MALLSGCTTFGVDNQTWNHMTPEEQKIAMNNYYQNQAQQQKQQAEIDKINAQNAPINNAISALESVANDSSNHKKCITDNFGQTKCGYNCYTDQFGEGHCAK